MRFLGPHACEEALERGELHSLWVAPAAFGRVAKLISEARNAGVVIHRDPMESLDRRAQGLRHQGVLGQRMFRDVHFLGDWLNRDGSWCDHGCGLGHHNRRGDGGVRGLSADLLTDGRIGAAEANRFG